MHTFEPKPETNNPPYLHARAICSIAIATIVAAKQRPKQDESKSTKTILVVLGKGREGKGREGRDCE